MNGAIADRIKSIASDIFGIPSTTLTQASSPENVENWDSARHLSFILALEEAFEVQLSPEETERINSIGQAIEVIEEKRGAVAE